MVAPGAAAAAEGPEVRNLFDAAKYGDMEAVEDFLAIGRDVNSADDEKRTPLHYACAYAHGCGCVCAWGFGGTGVGAEGSKCGGGRGQT
eukprot:365619-Chlamydomonas_euryale.AAC.1